MIWFLMIVLVTLSWILFALRDSKRYISRVNEKKWYKCMMWHVIAFVILHYGGMWVGSII